MHEINDTIKDLLHELEIIKITTKFIRYGFSSLGYRDWLNRLRRLPDTNETKYLHLLAIEYYINKNHDLIQYYQEKLQQCLKQPK